MTKISIDEIEFKEVLENKDIIDTTYGYIQRVYPGEWRTTNYHFQDGTTAIEEEFIIQGEVEQTNYFLII